jgi:hypothetical protein
VGARDKPEHDAKTLALAHFHPCQTGLSLHGINIWSFAMSAPEDARQREAKAALDRVKRDQEGIFSSSMARASDHFSGKDAPPDDNVELWGRRIGRTLSLIAVVVLGYTLGVQLKLW